MSIHSPNKVGYSLQQPVIIPAEVSSSAPAPVSSINFRREISCSMVFPPLVVKCFSFLQYTSSFLFAQRTFTPFSGPFTQGRQTFKPFFVQFCQSKSIHSLKDAGVQNIECKLYPASRNRCTAFCAAVSFFLRFPGAFHFSQIFHISAFRWFCNSTVSSRHSSITVPSQYCFITVSKAFQTAPLKFPYSTIFLSFCAIC